MFFFFQAEDGIRDLTVTGVQTCALPILPTLYIIAGPNGVGKTTFADEYLPDEIKQLEFINADLIARGLSPYDPEAVAIRSEERRVGKECRSRWSPYH